MFDVAIIGAGVIGSMLGRELCKYKLRVCVLEKESDVSCGASKANSGIVHGGYDPEPHTLKARLNYEGVEKLFATAQLLNVPFKRNGSLVCAFSESEDEHIKELYNRGIKNSIKGLKIISGDEARELEPELSGEITSALKVDNSGIVCPYSLTIAAMGNAMDNGCELKTEFEVTEIEKQSDSFIIKSENGQIEAKYIVNCAGAYADKIANLIGDNSFEIIKRAGEYMLFDKNEGSKVSRTIFQTPSKEGKGVLVTPTTHGNMLIGPSATVVKSAEDLQTTPEGLEKISRLALKSAPNLNFRAVITSFTGIRASHKDGDFIIEPSQKDEHFINVAAIDSPGLTCSVSIAEYTVNILKEAGLELKTNPNFNPRRENTNFFKQMNDNEKNKFIKQNEAYGKIVCRCEGITEGEIRAAIKRNPRAVDVDGVKRRTRAGMGRCQGGFCAPLVMQILAEENGVNKQDITKKGKGSEQLSSKEV